MSCPGPSNGPVRSEVALDRLTRLHPKLIDLSLGRIEQLLAALGHPEAKLAPVVHIAGTNGKGSSLAFLRAMLEAAGNRVQVYTSPHLVRFHERIRLTGGPIAETDLVALLEACEAANGEAPITFFEVTTAAAFLAFAREPADIVLLETGLGGRLDATNLIAQPRVTAISPVSVDHVQFLGARIEEIAFEKAGILKPGVPAVIGPQPAAALAVIEARAAEVGAVLHRCGQEWNVRSGNGGFVFESGGETRRYPNPVLPGAHQIENAGLALACAESLEGFGLDAAACETGLARAEWPGRLQRLAGGPLAGLLPGDWELWLDGGHNAAAAVALGRELATWEARPLHLIYGMLDTKGAQGFLRPLAPLAETLHAVEIPGQPASLSAEDAAREAIQAGFQAQPSDSVAAALRSIAGSGAPGRVLICGSLYLAGQVLEENS